MRHVACSHLRDTFFLRIFSLCAGTQTPMTSPIAPAPLHFSSIVIDTHDDTTQRFLSAAIRSRQAQSRRHVDIPRMREGGLNAIFFSIWIDGRTTGPAAVQKALDQIDAVRENVQQTSQRHRAGPHR